MSRDGHGNASLQPVALVLGVGASRGLGAACCRRFAAAGHHVFVAGRTPQKLAGVVDEIRRAGGSAEALVMDVTRETDMQQAFDRALAPGAGRAPVDLVVFNAGDNQPTALAALDMATLESAWRVGCLAGFLCGREVARRLAPLGRGTVIFTGASASLRGRPRFAHFAAAKAGLRMLAQAMAREFGPQGLHIAHVVIDGGIDGDRLRQLVPTLAAERGPDGLLQPEAIAESYWQIHLQPASAWVHELDLRPSREPF